MAGKPRKEPTLAAQNCDRHFDEIIARVEAGETMPAVCASDPKFPIYATLWRWATRDPQRSARMKAAVAKQKEGAIFSAEAIEAGLRTIATSKVRHINEVRLPGEPSYGWYHKRSQTDPDMHARFYAALAARQAQPGFKPTRYDAAAYDRMLGEIASNPRRSLGALARCDEKLPTVGALTQRRRRNSEFAAKAAEVVRAKPAFFYARSKSRANKYHPDELRRPLVTNDLYQRAESLVPKFHDVDLRDDIRSDMILALLEGRSDEELRTERNAIVKSHHRRTSSRHIQSLDQILGEDFLVMDTLTTNPTYEAA